MTPAVDSRHSSASLVQTANSTSELISRFLIAIDEPKVTELPRDAPDPFAVLHASSDLLKAHTTKLSLLLINKPFTPSAIRKIIADDIAGSCLPAIMGSVQLCDTKTHSKVVCDEVKTRVVRLFKELQCFMKEVESLAGTPSESSDAGSSGATTSRDSLASTGVVWDACDKLMALGDLGIVGVVVSKAELYRDTLEDAIQELKDWSQEEEDDDGVDKALSDDADAQSDDENPGENGNYGDILTSLDQQKFPKNRVDLRTMLEAHLKNLNLVKTLFKALIKRRLKTLPTLEKNGTEAAQSVAVTTRVDQLMDLLKKIPDEADELAGGFYLLDEDAAEASMKDINAIAVKSIDLVRRNWDEQEDEFTSWSDKWKEAAGTT